MSRIAKIAAHLVLCSLIVACTTQIAAPAGAAETGATVASEPALNGETRLVEHLSGETAVPADPQRVIAMDPFVTLPTLLELDIPLVGYATYGAGSDVPAYIDPADMEGLEHVGYMQPNLETIAALRPDLIIGSKETVDAVYDQLAQIAPTVNVQLDTALGDWKGTVRKIAAAFDKEDAVNEQIAGFEARAAAFRAALEEQGGSPEVHFVRINPDQFRIHTPVHFAGQVMAEAGIRRPEVDLPATPNGDQIRFGMELLPNLDADVLFYMAGGGSIDAEAAQAMLDQTQANPMWGQLRAVQNDRVYAVDGDSWLLGGVAAAHAILDDLERYLLDEPLP